MNRQSLTPVVAAFVLLGTILRAVVPYTPGEAPKGNYKDFAKPFLSAHCYECHDEDVQKGDLNLLDLGSVDETNAAVWKTVWAQVTLLEMPPKKQPKPGVVERLRFSDWVVNELTRVMADKGGFKVLEDPSKGNYLDHKLLFGPLPGGIQLVPTSTPARIWRVTPQEHITRLNELINTEPAYDPERPGLRTHGDVVPTNHGGELKLYFGTDRIIKWQGGTVAYATAVKSIPVVLSSSRAHGFENYPSFYSVNSAEANQILNKAENILKYMAYGPLSIAKPEQITDDPNTYKMEGDIRGLPSALVYSTKVVRPLTPVYELMKAPEATEGLLRAAVDYLFEALTFRPPSPKESDDYLQLVKGSMAKVGQEEGIFMGLSAIFLDRDALFRPELVEAGKPDQYGRVMLQDWELGLALNHALRYIKPDEELRKAIVEGRMRTREDVAREVKRMLADDSIRKPRVLRFFRDYFDHDLGGYICKDSAALASTGVSTRGTAHYTAMFDATASTDRLIELVLAEDKEVLKELLTTQKVVATNADRTYYGRKNNQEEKAAILAIRKKAQEERAKEESAELEALEKEVAALEGSLRVNPGDSQALKALNKQRKELGNAKKKLEQAKKKKRGDEGSADVTQAKLNGPKIFARVSHRSFGSGSMKPDRILATAPQGERMGILTHPSWLVSHSDAMDNHAILRGRWIRERILGGGIPDVPITVDAMLPDLPQKTLRERMEVTRVKYCWTCHQKMDPLGLPFEMYNHAGLFRTEELKKPVDTTGDIIDSGDPALDGPVKDPFEMIQKLVDSERVEQVFVRHAFRFWMGRNETLNDAPVLQAAHKAYRDNGGSMDALITSLVTSDAFLYRKVRQ